MIKKEVLELAVEVAFMRKSGQNIKISREMAADMALELLLKQKAMYDDIIQRYGAHKITCFYLLKQYRSKCTCGLEEVLHDN